MISINLFGIWLIFSIIGSISSISHNQPRFCANASWNSTAMTFANSTIVGVTPYGIFINTNNTVFVAARSISRISIWLDGSSVLTGILSGGLNSPYSVFVTDKNEIYVDNGLANSRVDKWVSNSSNSTPAMYICAPCFSLFVDISNRLHCSISSYHQVIIKSLEKNSNIWSVIAGTGQNGSTADTLSKPHGIYVDKNLNLYIADSGNNRIQKFPPGNLNGMAIVGTGAAGTIALNFPTGIAFDADEYLFIVDSNNHRIIGQGPNGFRCIAGCFGNGSAANQLSFPISLSFDTLGNIFVTDRSNNRIQKFFFIPNSCNETITMTSTAVITSMSSTQSVSSSLSTPQMNPSRILSYNMPKFTASSSWNTSGITIASFPIGTYPYGIFVDTSNTLYVCASYLNRVLVWSESSTVPIRNLSMNSGTPYTIFVTINGDMYIDNGYPNNRVDKWNINATNSTSIMYVKNICWGLFIDIDDNLYCSMLDYHQVTVKSLDEDSTMWTIAAGTNCAGSTPSTLLNPRGIFVDENLNLYVADYGNHRIQKFPPNQLVATTVAGATAPGTVALSGPTGITLDADGYLFIVDCWNHRIVASGPNGFRCLAGCSAVSGSTPSRLYYPTMIQFDTYGNMIVADDWNHRIQKFLLIRNTSTLLTTASNAVQTSMRTSTDRMTSSLETVRYPETSTRQTTDGLTSKTNVPHTTGGSTAFAGQSTVVRSTPFMETSASSLRSSIQMTTVRSTSLVETTEIKQTIGIEISMLSSKIAIHTTMISSTTNVTTNKTEVPKDEFTTDRQDSMTTTKSSKGSKFHHDSLLILVVIFLQFYPPQ